METELKKYVRVNIVDAAPMTRWEYNTYRGWNVSAAPDEEGYILFYRKGKPDEYVSWCPKKHFDEVSRLID